VYSLYVAATSQRWPARHNAFFAIAAAAAAAAAA